MLIIVCGVAVGLGIFLLGPDVPWKSNPRRVVDSPAGPGSERTDVRGVIDAVATWTEQLRDTISAAGGLEQAIAATEELAPAALRRDVRRLVSDIKYGDAEQALRRFADSVAHPSCDFVVAALVTAHRHQAREVGELLSHLAECAREESRVHLRVWVSRARLRSALRIVKIVIVTFTLGLLILDAAYLEPFVSGQGMIVLSAILADFVLALLLLAKLESRQQVHRFIARRTAAS